MWILTGILKLILSYGIIVLQLLLSLHAGSLFVKLKSAAMLAIFVSPWAIMVTGLDTWYRENQDYVNVVFWAILIDYVLGTVKHTFFDKDFSIKENIVGLLTKVGLVLACGYLFEGLNIMLQQESPIANFVEIIARLMVFLYPAGSAFGNSSILSGGVFPPVAWMLRLNKFKENLNPAAFTQVEVPEVKPKTKENEPYKINNPFRE